MLFIAFIADDNNLNHVLSQHVANDYLLHCLIPSKEAKDFCIGLDALNYAGAICLDLAWQKKLLGSAARPSLAATTAQATDTLVTTPAGLMADFNAGQAIAQLLSYNEWDIKDAAVTITGADAYARILAKELASLGATSIDVIAASRSLAQQTLPTIATTRSHAHTYSDITATSAYERADLIIRTESEGNIPKDVLGPHVSVIDLSPSPLSPLRHEALRVGAPNFGLRDFQAHQISIAIGAILGKKIDPETFLMPLLSLTE